MAIAPPKLVGAPVKRREDPRLITGSATYTDDVRLVDMAYLAVVRSPYAHARIRSINVERARRAPGVLLVLTGEDVQRLSRPLPVDAVVDNMKRPERYALATGKVRLVGDPVVAVVAEDRYLARDAAELVEVDYEPLPAVVDPERALEPDAPRLYDEFPDNIACRKTGGEGDVDEAFRQADAVIRQRFVNQRLIPMAMEPRSVVAQYNRGTRELTLWSSTQIPHLLRTRLAETIGLPENRVRVIAPEVGGGFGSKLNVYPEEILCALASMQLGRPVKFTEERRENMVATIHGRDQVDYVEAAVKRDGTLLGLRVRVIADLGAYFQLLTPGIPTLTPVMLPGCYRVQNLAYEYIGVFTNKTPTDAYRGAGRPEATYLIERTMDLIAAELGLDPVEVRRRNFIPAEAFPWHTPGDYNYDSGNYEAALSKALELVNYQQFRQEQERARQQGRYLGIGFSTYVEICGMGPSRSMPFGGWESATVRVEPSGTVTVLTGVSPHGQGQETSFAQLVADELGVDLDQVVVIHGDTAQVPMGIGTFGSRAMALGGTAVLRATERVKEKARQIAAHMLEASPEDLEFGGGRVSVRGAPDRGVPFRDVARAAYLATDTIAQAMEVQGRPLLGLEPGMEATYTFEPTNFTFPFGTHVAIVEVDAETGQIFLRRYIAVDDCGRRINPMLVDGQIHGGVAQGIAQALYEYVEYDADGNLLTGTLMDYAVPKASQLPSFELAETVTPSPCNPLGVKGVGEAGTIASTPAVVNAVVDALRPFGVRHIDLPLKPEKIWRIIQQARSNG